MATTETNKLKDLYAQLAPGAPVSSAQLARLGISTDLAVYYARAGWLVRLARGVYRRPEQGLLMPPSLNFLAQSHEGLHVGGKSALQLHGIQHQVAQQETVHLFAWSGTPLPRWFTTEFSVEYHRMRLFKEKPNALLHVAPFANEANAPLVSSPERALLELLNEVGVRQPLSEARQLMESTYTLRGTVLTELLKRCTRVKAVRLCLQLGRELSLPWMSQLNPAKLPTGGKRPWVGRTADGFLVLKPDA